MTGAQPRPANGKTEAPPPATINPLTEVQQQLTSPRMTEQLTMALPEHISVEKFQRVAVTAINKSPELVEADRQSLFTACVEAATDGLLPNGKEAALVIFNTKVKQGGREFWIKKVQYMPMIAGIHKKARNSGEIAMLNAHVVKERDEFEYGLGLEPFLTHKPFIGDRGRIVAVYAVSKLKDGSPEIEVMSVPEVEEIRAVSKNPEGGPWKKYWGEMARKTVVRRLSKRLPMSSDLERMIQSVDAMYSFDERKERPMGPAPARPKALDYQESEVLPPAATAATAAPAEPPREPYALVSEHGEVIEEIEGSGLYADALIYHVKRIPDLGALQTFMENNQAMLDRLTAEGNTDHVEAVVAWHDERVKDLTPDPEPEQPDRPPAEKAAKKPAAKATVNPNPDAKPAPETKQDAKPKAEPEPEPTPEPEPDTEPDGRPMPPEEGPVEPPEAEVAAEEPAEEAAEEVDMSAYQIPMVAKANSDRPDWIAFHNAGKRLAREVGATGIATLREANAESLKRMQVESKHNFHSLMAELQKIEEAG